MKPGQMPERILLDHGNGGRAAQRLVKDLFLRHFSNPYLDSMDDAARVILHGETAVSTDSYTVDPLEFPGGDIGSLAVHGTVNDVSMLGAQPLYLSAAFIIEEGLEFSLLERIVASMGQAATECGVRIITGDTKVVPRGAADRLFINTTGIGRILTPSPPHGAGAKPGDAILISGSMGDHGLTIMASRDSLSLDGSLRSDSAPLNRMVEALVTEVGDIHVLRDPTRGGLATTLNEIAVQSAVSMEIDENAIPILPSVSAGCSVLGLDPLYLANEGKLICILPESLSDKALSVMKTFSQGKMAVKIGKIIPAQASPGKPGRVILRTIMGGSRLLPMLEGEQLPRIC